MEISERTHEFLRNFLNITLDNLIVVPSYIFNFMTKFGGFSTQI